MLLYMVSLIYQMLLVSLINKSPAKKDITIPSLVNYQTHRHARTCRKKGKAICRFNFPIPLMSSTVILEPLNDDDDDDEACREKIYEGSYFNDEMNNVDV